MPSGAIAVRLCNAAGDLFYADESARVESDFQPPSELLTTGVDEVIDTVNRLESGNDVEFCGGVGGFTSVYWSIYPDGTARAISWRYGDCADVTVAPGERRLRGADVQEAFASNLAEQRATLPLPGQQLPPLACNPNDTPVSTVVAVEWFQLQSAIICRLEDRKWRRGVLTDRQSQRLSDGLSANAVEQSARCGPAWLDFKIVGYTPWGDLVSLPGRCDTVRVPELPRYPFVEPPATWRMPDKIIRMLESVPLGRPQPQQPYGDPIPG